MFSDVTLSANLVALERIQGQRPAVENPDTARTRLRADGAGGAVLEILTGDGTWAVVDEPLADASARQVIVVGGGLGAAIRAVERAGASTRILVLEPDAGVATLLLAQHDWSTRILDGRLVVLTGPDYRGAMNCARLLDVVEPPVVLASATLLSHRLDDMKAARAVAVKLVAEATANLTARRRFAGRYLQQTITNLPTLAGEGDIDALEGRFRGRPAIVVGAGPTLDRNLPALAALQDRAVVIAADTTLRPLLAGGVRPHLVVAVDPAELNAEHLADVAAGTALDGIFLAAEGSLHPSAFDGFRGRTFVFKVSDHEPWPWLRGLGADRGSLRAWGSVVTSAFDLALRLGCDPIVFAGLDLSYPERRPYCAHTLYDRKWREAMATYGCTWQQLIDDFFDRLNGVMVPDLHGVPVLTSPPLLSFRDWLQQQIAAETTRRIVNATGAGIMHGPRLEQRALAEVLQQAPSLGTSVGEALAAAHAASVAPHDRVPPALAALVDRADGPEARAVLQRWADFSAGTLTPGQILDTLGHLAAVRR